MIISDSLHTISIKRPKTQFLLLFLFALCPKKMDDDISEMKRACGSSAGRKITVFHKTFLIFSENVGFKKFLGSNFWGGIIGYQRGSHSLLAQKAQRKKSRGSIGLKLGVKAWRTTTLLLYENLLQSIDHDDDLWCWLWWPWSWLQTQTPFSQRECSGQVPMHKLSA